MWSIVICKLALINLSLWCDYFRIAIHTSCLISHFRTLAAFLCCIVLKSRAEPPLITHLNKEALIVQVGLFTLWGRFPRKMKPSVCPQLLLLWSKPGRKLSRLSVCGWIWCSRLPRKSLAWAFLGAGPQSQRSAAFSRRKLLQIGQRQTFCSLRGPASEV